MARPRRTKPADGTQTPAAPAAPEVAGSAVGQTEPPAVESSGPAPIEPPPATSEPPAVQNELPAAPMKLKEFVAHHEQAAQERGAVVVQISHPDADPGIRQGTYSGIRMLEGDPAAVYSDGSKH